jgi:hypothetical protein
MSSLPLKLLGILISHNLNHENITQFKLYYKCYACLCAAFKLLNWAVTELLLGYCMLYALCYMLYALCLTSKYCPTIMLLNHTLLNNSILHPNHATHNTTFWNYYWYNWTNSKVLKSSKTDIFNIQLGQIYKKTYIFCNSIIYKNNNFTVSKYHLAARILSTRSLRHHLAMHHCENTHCTLFDISNIRTTFSS